MLGLVYRYMVGCGGFVGVLIFCLVGFCCNFGTHRFCLIVSLVGSNIFQFRYQISLVCIGGVRVPSGSSV